MDMAIAVGGADSCARAAVESGTIANRSWRNKCSSPMIPRPALIKIAYRGSASSRVVRGAWKDLPASASASPWGPEDAGSTDLAGGGRALASRRGSR